MDFSPYYCCLCFMLKAIIYKGKIHTGSCRFRYAFWIIFPTVDLAFENSVTSLRHLHVIASSSNVFYITFSFLSIFMLKNFLVVTFLKVLENQTLVHSLCGYAESLRSL